MNDNDAVVLVETINTLGRAVATAQRALTVCHEALCMNERLLTCDEAEAMYDAYRGLGFETMAEQFMTAHASGDQPGDRHVFIDRGLGIGEGGDGWRYATDSEIEAAEGLE